MRQLIAKMMLGLQQTRLAEQQISTQRMHDLQTQDWYGPLEGERLAHAATSSF